jgi:hypothetical protein
VHPEESIGKTINQVLHGASTSSLRQAQGRPIPAFVASPSNKLPNEIEVLTTITASSARHSGLHRIDEACAIDIPSLQRPCCSL